MARLACKLLGAMALLGTLAGGAAASTFTVTSNADDGSSLTPGTLRWAVNQANTVAGAPHTIVISVSNSITIFAPLTITQNLITVDGRGNTVGQRAMGSNASNDIWITSGNYCILENMAIILGRYGVQLTGNNNQIRGCSIGTDWANNINKGFIRDSISVTGNNNTIGGPASIDRNIICNPGAMGEAVFISNATGTILKNNFVGFDSTGEIIVGDYSSVFGIFLSGAKQTLIGGTLHVDGNLIAGNHSSGIQVNNSTGNTICGNIIGFSLSGNKLFPSNSHYGIALGGSSGNWIGMPVSGGQNIIAGNTTNAMGNGFGIFAGNCDNLIIQNNYCGFHPESGKVAENNIGIQITPASGCLVGGNRAPGLYEKNFICGTIWAVNVNGAGNTVCGNFIGLNQAGNGPVFSVQSGIEVSGGNNNLIGGANLDASHLYGNIVSGITTGNGLYIFSGGGNTIAGNWFGLDASGGNQVNNSVDDILLNGVAGNLIGGGTQAAANYICGSATGVNVSASSGNTIVGNYFSVMKNGQMASTILNCGISINSSSNNNLVGEKNTSRGNLIAGSLVGVIVDGAATTANAFFGNTLCSFSNPATGAGVFLSNGGNLNKAIPVIQTANAGVVSGQAQVGDYIEVFKADRSAGYKGGSLKSLGHALADGSGNWNLTVAGVVDGDYVCAMATDAANNTSGFSLNHLFSWPPTPTCTITPTATITPTITPTATISATATITPSATITITPLPIAWDGKTVLAYPNPAKDELKFAVKLDRAASVRIEIYNINAERVKVLSGSLTPEVNTLACDCREMGTGIYMARVFVDNKEISKLKVAVLK